MKESGDKRKKQVSILSIRSTQFYELLFFCVGGCFWSRLKGNRNSSDQFQPIPPAAVVSTFGFYELNKENNKNPPARLHVVLKTLSSNSSIRDTLKKATQSYYVICPICFFRAAFSSPWPCKSWSKDTTHIEMLVTYHTFLELLLLLFARVFWLCALWLRWLGLRVIRLRGPLQTRSFQI